MPRRATLLLMLILAWVAPARSDASSFGLRAGFVESRFHGGYGDVFGNRHRAGLAFAFHGNLTLTRVFALQPELWWSMKGATADPRFVLVTAGDPDGSDAETLGFHIEDEIPYLELPVLLRFEPVQGRPWSPYLVAGPSVSLRIGGDRDLELEGFGANLVHRDPRMRAAAIFEKVGTFDSTPKYKRWDVGAVGGAGFSFGDGARRYLGELRYSRGFIDVMPSSLIGHSTSGAWMFLLGVEWR